MYPEYPVIQNARNRMMSNFISDTLTYHDGNFFSKRCFHCGQVLFINKKRGFLQQVLLFRTHFYQGQGVLRQTKFSKWPKIQVLYNALPNIFNVGTNYRQQILTSEVDPRTGRIEYL